MVPLLLDNPVTHTDGHSFKGRKLWAPALKGIALSIESISSCFEVVGTFFRREEHTDVGDGFPELINGSGGCCVKVGFEFAESHVDGVEIMAVGRQKKEPCAFGTDEAFGLEAFVVMAIFE